MFGVFYQRGIHGLGFFISLTIYRFYTLLLCFRPGLRLVFTSDGVRVGVVVAVIRELMT